MYYSSKRVILIEFRSGRGKPVDRKKILIGIKHLRATALTRRTENTALYRRFRRRASNHSCSRERSGPTVANFDYSRTPSIIASNPPGYLFVTRGGRIVALLSEEVAPPSNPGTELFPKPAENLNSRLLRTLTK